MWAGGADGYHCGAGVTGHLPPPTASSTNAFRETAHMIGFPRRTAAALACLALAACGENGTSITELDRTVAEVRAATAKYANVDKALADGYTTDGHCVL